jgi:hypothetical protein
MPNNDFKNQPRHSSGKNKGKFAKAKSDDDITPLRKKARDETGYTDIKNPEDMKEEMVDVLLRKKLINDQTKFNKYGFTEDFFKFLGLNGKAQNYHNPAPAHMLEKLTGDAASYFTPVDDFYGTPGGGDTIYDYGRIPVSHLLVLSSQRLGIVYRACNGTAGDVVRNRFEFVRYDNPDKVIKRPEMMSWMRHTRFWDHLGNIVDWDGRTGQGNLISYYPGQVGTRNMYKPPPKSRPDSFETFSAYAMTPVNLHDEKTRLDYNKQRWKFRGGIIRNALIHEKRVYVMETRRVEGGLRGLALAEIAWTPLMCYLNTMYYILKGLSRLGTVLASVNSDKEYPTTTEVAKYIELWDLMKANNLFVLGKNATFNLQNVAGQISTGIREYLEFLIEDISAAWVFPKNQLLGRSEGGGLDGAGALVSKEDYLSSNISVKQLIITNDIMEILEKMCGFKDLEDLTLRWNIDLHKTQEQRLKEQSMEEQLEVQKIQTKQAKLQMTLFRKQVELQKEMSDVQLKMLRADPESFMAQSSEDEENLEKKETPKGKNADFVNLLKAQYFILEKQYIQNDKILNYLSKNRAKVEA